MKLLPRLAQFAIVAVLVMAAVTASAQGPLSGQDFTINKSSCGQVNANYDGCVVSFNTPPLPTGERSWGTLNLSSDGTGTISWENSPLGELGTSNAQWTCTAFGTFNGSPVCTAMTVTIGGDYLPLYGGASYTGVLSMDFTYSLVPINRWTRRVVRTITGDVKVS